MPHICTRCNHVFEAGEDILKGCPNCGWKKFMFLREKGSSFEIAKEINQEQPYQLITEAMGVRIPARKAPKASVKEGNEHHIDHNSIQPPSIKSNALDKSIATLPKKPKKAEDKLESVKITAPGTYELNLPTLFERDELIMAVKEGTYFIDLSSAFKKGKKD